MIYRNFKDKKLSALGMGCMRLPCVDGDNSKIDMEAAKEMFAYAFEKGINYVDTAWGYHHGMSEPVVGEILADYPRDSFYLASKFPGYDLSNMDKVEEIFEKQLKRCRVDYFDFYLFHCLNEANVGPYLDEKYGIYDYLMKQKANGRIKHLGFSTHGSLHTMKRFLDAYGKDMEFCQLQINWLDWELQNAKEKVELVSSYNIPIWIMEPVRGGSLVKLEPQYAEELKKLRPDATMAEWAFRFLQGREDFVVTLSGMSDLSQIKENIATYEEEKPLSEKEMEVILGIASKKIAARELHCTACKYCTEYCPMELDIPGIIKLYNELVFPKDGIDIPARIADMDESKRPSSCLGCRACEEVCPQGIRISKMMSDFTERLSK